ncbi:NYN domain-containing protein [Aquabacterium lacunae]|uniref:NYN domain-containing protein n=1 Tax=Aquabacterium lacunae TaxID=2528630 RepID=A0A4Q9GXF6_9BURK|nr:NYN domain-containing protein [Aquabacterium lacunae]TBO30076.1 NYN domain-containing protein [Aquabacterium lacunae]
MAHTPDHISMALFCDFENVALGVRDANYDKFDIKKVLERLLLKGSIVVKKSYCDWERYKGFKAAMHEANFELIEIPHVRQSGKNSADIRLVVDALDLCYTKSHVNTFVIISGDSDFSPLVSKLRENAKHVIGVGVKQSTSDLLIANCDEFIFYDDLVRGEAQRQARRDSQNGRDSANTPRRSPEEEKRRLEELDARRTKGVILAAETYEALVTDRDDGGKIWASVLKEALKRRNPGFNENYYGFKTFGNLLEDAQARGLLTFGRDEKSGAFVSRGTGARAELAADDRTAEEHGTETQPNEAAHERQERGDRSERQERGDRTERGRRGGRDRRGRGRDRDEGTAQGAPVPAASAPQGAAEAPASASASTPAPVPAAPEPVQAAVASEPAPTEGQGQAPRNARSRTRKPRTADLAPATETPAVQPVAAPVVPPAAAEPATEVAPKATTKRPASKQPARKRAASAPRKTAKKTAAE